MKVISPSFKFDGWSFWKAIKGTIKQSIYLLVPAAITYITTENPQLSGVMAIVGKFILGSLEYFFKEYKV